MTDLATRPAPAGITPEDFAFVADLVRRRSAIVLETGKEYLVESRLRPVAEKHGLDGLADLVRKLRATADGPVHERVIEAMTTNETSFFRDLHPFEALKTLLLPEAIERNRATRKLRIWCGASSSGQEPYTVALVVKQHFPELADWDVEIRCTDLSPEMVTRTATGRYSQLEVNRGLPAPLLVTWFHQKGTEWEAAPGLRDLLKVHELNLVGDWPFDLGPFDIVFLRNVLIYFDPVDKAKVLERIADRMVPGGALYLGAAESTLGLCDRFERTTGCNTSWYARKG